MKRSPSQITTADGGLRIQFCLISQFSKQDIRQRFQRRVETPSIRINHEWSWNEIPESYRERALQLLGERPPKQSDLVCGIAKAAARTNRVARTAAEPGSFATWRDIWR
jgi:hypothetical protein